MIIATFYNSKLIRKEAVKNEELGITKELLLLGSDELEPSPNGFSKDLLVSILHLNP